MISEVRLPSPKPIVLDVLQSKFPEDSQAYAIGKMGLPPGIDITRAGLDGKKPYVNGYANGIREMLTRCGRVFTQQEQMADPVCLMTTEVAQGFIEGLEGQPYGKSQMLATSDGMVNYTAVSSSAQGYWIGRNVAMMRVAENVPAGSQKSRLHLSEWEIPLFDEETRLAELGLHAVPDDQIEQYHASLFPLDKEMQKLKVIEQRRIKQNWRKRESVPVSWRNYQVYRSGFKLRLYQEGLDPELVDLLMHRDRIWGYQGRQYSTEDNLSYTLIQFLRFEVARENSSHDQETINIDGYMKLVEDKSDSELRTMNFDRNDPTSARILQVIAGYKFTEKK